jgi:hypothetical protein
MRSGPLTPAAATLTSTSPGPGAGTGRSTGFSTSGPPGLEISTAFIVFGSCVLIARSQISVCD